MRAGWKCKIDDLGTMKVVNVKTKGLDETLIIKDGELPFDGIIRKAGDAFLRDAAAHTRYCELLMLLGAGEILADFMAENSRMLNEFMEKMRDEDGDI